MEGWTKKKRREELKIENTEWILSTLLDWRTQEKRRVTNTKSPNKPLHLSITNTQTGFKCIPDSPLVNDATITNSKFAGSS